MVSSVRPISAAGSCRPITRSPRRAIRRDVQRWPRKSGSAAAEKRPTLLPPPSRNLLRPINRGADRGRIRRRRRNRVRHRETHLAESKSALRERSCSRLHRVLGPQRSRDPPRRELRTVSKWGPHHAARVCQHVFDQGHDPKLVFDDQYSDAFDLQEEEVRFRRSPAAGGRRVRIIGFAVPKGQPFPGSPFWFRARLFRLGAVPQSPIRNREMLWGRRRGDGTKKARKPG